MSMAEPDARPYKGFRDKAAHDRAHELLRIPWWHPDVPKPGMRHVLKKQLRLCLTSEGYCDYEEQLDRQLPGTAEHAFSEHKRNY
jgi:hypothetical protein